MRDTNELYLALLASVIVAIVFHYVRYIKNARVARIRQFYARALNLVLAGIAAWLVVFEFRPVRIFATALLIYTASSVLDGLITEFRIYRGSIDRG